MTGNVNTLNQFLREKISEGEAALVDLLCEATGRNVFGVAGGGKWRSGLHSVAGGGASMTLAPPIVNEGGVMNKLCKLADAAGYSVTVNPAGKDVEVGIIKVAK